MSGSVVLRLARLASNHPARDMRELSQPIIATVGVVNLHVDISARNQNERHSSNSYKKITHDWVIGRPMASE